MKYSRLLLPLVFGALSVSSAAAQSAPSVVSFSPNSGGAVTQNFTVVVNVPSGAANLNNIQLLFNTTASRFYGCNVSYDVYTNTISLYNNAGTGFVGMVIPRSSAQVSNSQCTLSGAGSSYISTTLGVALTFSGTFTGQQNVYAYVQGNDRFNNGW